MQNEENILAVARYLEGGMDQQERQAFELLLAQDAELRELEAKYKDIHQSLKIKIAPSEADLQLEHTLSAMRTQYFKEEPSQSNQTPSTTQVKAKEAKVVPMKSYLKWLSVAAILVIGLFIWAPWSTSLYDQYSFSKQMSIAERGADQESPLAKGAALFNDGKYAEARKILQQEYMMTPQNPLLAYYFAITLIETGQEYEARTVLINLYNGKSVLKYDAAFYVALSFVKQGENAQAIEWLAKIPQDNVNYSKAQSLRAKLK